MVPATCFASVLPLEVLETMDEELGCRRQGQGTSHELVVLHWAWKVVDRASADWLGVVTVNEDQVQLETLVGSWRGSYDR